MRAPSRLAATTVGVAAAMSLGAIACGNDDDIADLSYCDALTALAAEGAAIGPEANPDAVEAALDRWEQVARAAPPESADAARVMADAATVVARDGSDAELDLDAVAQASAALVTSAADTCDVDLMSGSDS